MVRKMCGDMRPEFHCCISNYSVVLAHKMFTAVLLLILSGSDHVHTMNKWLCISYYSDNN